MIPQFQQNKISGLSIAWGRAVWDYDQNCYTFPSDDSYQIRVTDSWLMDHGVTEDDLLDCVAQIEDAFGSPDEHRPNLGLFPNSGYANIGTTVQSRSYPAIRCVFTPTSTTDNMPDAYFEWYFDTSSPAVRDLNQFLLNFDAMSGNRATNVSMSPVMPSYMEAQEFFSLNRNRFPDQDVFLSELWKYHQTTNKGFKRRLSEELLPLWTSMLHGKKKSLGEQTKDREKDVLKWIDDLKKVVERESKKNKVETTWKTVGFDKGQKYFRVYTDLIKLDLHKMAIYFIDKQGNIFKAAGWKQPANGIRGTIDTVDPENVGKMLTHTLGMHKVP